MTIKELTDFLGNLNSFNEFKFIHNNIPFRIKLFPDSNGVRLERKFKNDWLRLSSVHVNDVKVADDSCLVIGIHKIRIAK
jgi:hypothetical protein